MVVVPEQVSVIGNFLFVASLNLEELKFVISDSFVYN